MKKILVTAFKNKKDSSIQPPVNFLNSEVTAYVIPANELSDIKKIEDLSVQGNYSSATSIRGIILEG